ncbi:hypothetical protein [Tersicoccus phoenicis]|nr:hypothetical protein [Tersicoccus phoenicis]
MRELNTMGFGDAINKGKDALGNDQTNGKVDQAQEQYGDKLGDKGNQAVDAAQQKFGGGGDAGEGQ